MNNYCAGSVESAAGRAAGERAIAIRHSGHSLVPRPWERGGYSGLPESTGACVHASSLATPLHPPTITSHDTISCSTCNGYPEAELYQYLVFKSSEANDPQCKEDDNVALLWPFRVMCKRSYAHAQICRLMNN